MKLYGHDTSPYVRRIRVLLAEKGLPFERDANGWTSPELPRVNPLMRVPALFDGSEALLDSKLIANYVYERYPQAPPPPPAGMLPLAPTLWQPQQRYADENVVLAIDAATDSAVNVFLLELDGIAAAQSPYLLRQGQRIRRCLEFLDERYAGRDTLHDGVWSFADIAITCALDWMRFRDRYPVSAHANLVRFLETHKERPALRETHPSRAQNTAPPKTPSAGQ